MQRSVITLDYTSGQPVGVLDIADALQVTRQTVYRWIRETDFPEPNATVNRSTPIWSWGRIEQWHNGRRSADVSPVVDGGGSAGV